MKVPKTLEKPRTSTNHQAKNDNGIALDDMNLKMEIVEKYERLYSSYVPEQTTSFKIEKY